MKTLEEIQEQLQLMNNARIADKAGLTRAYVNALANGTRLNPTYNTLKKINDAIEDLLNE